MIPRLAREKTSEAQTALRELLHEPLLAHTHDWIHHLLEQQAETAAESRPWTPSDVREFVIAYEIDPKTDRDLFKIACKRFKELKSDVEKSENSLRDELRQGDSESQLRRWLARKLNERARHRYTVPQEAVIDLEERPDLRLENPKTAAVSVEVKWQTSVLLTTCSNAWKTNCSANICARIQHVALSTLSVWQKKGSGTRLMEIA